MRCILVGNYGVGNVGDEALKEYFLQAFPEMEWTVLSAHPVFGQLHRLPAGFRSFFGTGWGKTLRCFWRTDAVVFGGGSLFTDTESSFACWIWFLHAFVAYIFGKPYFLAFQGIGPFRFWQSEWCTKWVISHAAFVSVRDEKSAQRIEDFNMNINCVRTFDPVILSIQNDNSVRSQNVISVIPRHNSGTAFLNGVLQACSENSSAELLVLLMQPDDAAEQGIAKEVLQRTGRGVVVPVRTLSALCDHLALSRLVITERYHGALAALRLRVPVRVVAQAEGDKLSDLQKYTDDPLSFAELEEQARAGERALRQALSGTLDKVSL